MAIITTIGGILTAIRIARVVKDIATDRPIFNLVSSIFKPGKSHNNQSEDQKMPTDTAKTGIEKAIASLVVGLAMLAAEFLGVGDVAALSVADWITPIVVTAFTWLIPNSVK